MLFEPDLVCEAPRVSPGEHRAGALAQWAVRRAARGATPSQVALGAMHAALQALRGRLLSPSASALPREAFDDRELACLSIAALSLQCAALRPDADPRVIELGAVVLRREIAQHHLAVLGVHVAAEPQAMASYLAAVTDAAIADDLRERIAQSLPHP